MQRIRSALSAFAALVLVFSAATGAVELKPNHPDRYAVKKGDTLWDIAATFLQKPWRWPEIWRSNSHVRNPHRIYPGDELVLRYRDGVPVLEFANRESDLVGAGRDVKISPGVHTSSHDEHIPPVPLDAIWPFLSRPRVVGPGQLAAAPYVLSSQDEHLIGALGTRLYARGFQVAPIAKRYSIVRCGEVYRRVEPTRDGNYRFGARPGVSQGYQSTCSGEADNRDILGYEAIDVGDATLLKGGDPATFLVSRAQVEILAGDRLVPQSEPELPEFIPHAPASAVAGHVLSVMGALSQVGPYEAVVIDRGLDAALEPGHVLAVAQSGILVDDKFGTYLRKTGFDLRQGGNAVELPNEHIGEIMVFRVFDHISYGLVVRAERSIHVGDAVATPE